MSSEKDSPRVKKNGELQLSSGTGPVKSYQVRKYQPVDTVELQERGLLPEGGLSWSADDLQTMRYRKFGPEQREIFLTKLAETGRIKVAAWHAGVLPSTVERHRTADPSLEEETKLALEMYHEQTVALITAQARAGMQDIRYGKDGEIVARRVTYEQQLRIRLLERADSDYKQVQKSEVSVTGGAVVIPAPIDDITSWDELVKRHTGGALPDGDKSALSTESIDTIGETAVSGEKSEPGE